MSWPQDGSRLSWDSTKQPKMAQKGPKTRWAKISQDGPAIAQDTSRMARGGAKEPQNDPRANLDMPQKRPQKDPRITERPQNDCRATPGQLHDDPRTTPE